MKLAHLSATALAFSLAIGAAAAAVENGSVIGMTSGLTGTTLDNSKVGSGATLFDGSTVQTTSNGDGSYSRIHLNDGTRLDFGAASKARVFAKRATLEIGTTEVQSASGYEIDTQLLKIQPVGATSVARIKVENGNRVFVTALNAPVKVLNQQGMLLAQVNPGLPLSFLPQAGAQGTNQNQNQNQGGAGAAAGGAGAGAGAGAAAGGAAAGAAAGISTTVIVVGVVAAATAIGVGAAAADGAFSSSP